MVFKWREQHTPILLDLLRSRECLWNNKCENYKKKEAREKAIQSLICDLNLSEVTVGDIKAKIKTIRTRYAAELAKIIKSEYNGERVEGIYEPKLFWFKKADSFLRAVYVPRKSMEIQNDIDDFISQSENDEEGQVLKSEKLHCDNGNALEGIGAALPDEEKRSGIDRTIRTWSSLHPSAKRGKRRACDSQVWLVERAVDSLQKIARENGGTTSTENEFDVFCKSLAIQLKNMPLHRALICQEKLQSVMVNERLQQLSEMTDTGI